MYWYVVSGQDFGVRAWRLAKAFFFGGHYSMAFWGSRRSWMVPFKVTVLSRYKTCNYQLWRQLFNKSPLPHERRPRNNITVLRQHAIFRAKATNHEAIV